MKKSLLKLITISLLVVITLVVAVTSSFAWFSVSDAPAASGLQFTVGASNTIRVAADTAVETEEGTLHYPAAFSDSLQIANNPAYAHLQNMVGLTPVSTADGVHWYFPTYYDSADGEYAGLQGTVRDISEFLLDSTYAHANRTTLPADDSVQGSYAMLDFWVVSPAHCRLRLSVGAGAGGSYVVSAPKPTADGNGSYRLPSPDDALSASVRVGFLTNTRAVTDASMQQYVASDAYDAAYRKLKGVYQEAGEPWNGYPSDFTIYEPNADLHTVEPSYILTQNGQRYRTCTDGSYVRTWPIGYVNGRPTLVDMTARTAIQTRAEWLTANNSERMIQQIFKAYLAGVASPQAEALHRGFYGKYLGYQSDAYLQKGRFIKNSENLTRAFDDDGVVESDVFAALNTAGATDDVIIVELEKNVPQRIRMFVWIEGQDADCAHIGGDGGLLVNLELAGSTG